MSNSKKGSRPSLDLDFHGGLWTEKRKAKVMQAGELMCDVFASEEFRRRVQKFSWTHKGVVNYGFKGTEDTPCAILNMIDSGADIYNDELDYDIDVFMGLFSRRWSGVIGYTYANTMKTWLNVKFLNAWWNQPHKIASNMAHEYLHNLDYSHSAKYNTTRRYTVPYAIGYIVRDIAGEMLGQADNSEYDLKCSGWWIFKRCKWVKR